MARTTQLTVIRNIDRVDASPISIETANCYCDVRIKTEPVVPTAPSNEIGDSDDINAHIPTEHEQTTLRRVAGPLPKSAFLVAVVELCERFAYYGIAGPFQVRMKLTILALIEYMAHTTA